MTQKKPNLPTEEGTLHTDMELEQLCEDAAEDGVDATQNEPISQTNSEIGESPVEAADGPVEPSPSDVNSQTDTENAASDDADPKDKEAGPKKRKRAAKKKSESNTEASAPKEDVAPAEEKPRRHRPIRLIQEVVSIDDERTVETDSDKEKNDLLDLTESLKSGRILTGSVQGVETTESDAVAVIYHGAYKVIIPTREAIAPPSNYRDIPKAEVHEYLLTKRLGAEFDYIVKGIDPEAKIAVASRLEAMRAKRKWHYYDIEKEAGRFLYEGVCAEARVVSVIRTGIFVDLFGVEVFIPLHELSYQRMMDAAYHFQTGQRVIVKVLAIDRKDRNNIQVTASVKQAAENPCEKAIRRFTVGNKYVGTVSMIDTHGVFVALDGGIDCLCSYPKRGRPPRGARVTVRINGINKETNRIWGSIIHTALSRIV